MTRQASKFKVGLFVLVGVLIGVGALIYLGAQTYFKGAVTYATYFAESVQGLQVDSVVKYRGVEIGRVRTIGVAPDHTLIEVIMDIGFNGPIDHGMSARLKQVGITGIAYVELDRADPEEPNLSPALGFTPEYPVIPSRPSDIAQLWSLVEDVVRQVRKVDFKSLADTLQDSLSAAQQILDNSRLATTLANVEKASANLVSVTAKADRFMDQAELEKVTLHAQQALAQARDLLAETRAQVAGLNLARAGQTTNELIDEVKDTAGGLSSELRITAENLRQASENMNRLMQRLEKSPSDALFSSPPARGAGR